jgi:probable rRNA maturation factor
MYQIDVADTQDCLEVDEEFLIQVAERVLAEEQVAAAEISVALVDNPTIHEINRQYLGHDYPTDVICFLLECEPAEEGSPSPNPATYRGKGKRLDGEVIISTETAQKEAENYGWSPREEVVLYLVHGLLHLVGYDDLSSTEQSVMRARERAMLALFHISPRHPLAATEGENAHSPPAQPEAEPGEEPERPSSASLPQTRRTES